MRFRTSILLIDKAHLSYGTCIVNTLPFGFGLSSLIFSMNSRFIARQNAKTWVLT